MLLYFFSFSFNQQALEPDNQAYYTTEIGRDRGSTNRPAAVHMAAPKVGELDY